MKASTPTLITLGRRIRIQEVLQYIQMRQNEDGGYSFARGAGSSAADTYYGIQILRMLGAEPRNVAKTIDFMKRLQREDGSFDSVNVAYDVVKTLDELGARLHRPLEDFVLSLSRPRMESLAFLRFTIRLASNHPPNSKGRTYLLSF